MATNIAIALQVNAGVTGGQAVDELTDKLRKMAAAGNVSAGQIKQAYRQLPAQFTDIAVSLAGGQSPFMVLLQQGGQIRDQFGSIGNAARAMASFITPARIAMAGLAGGVIAVTKAAMDGDSEFSKFQRVLSLTGNTAAVTYSQFIRTSRAIAEATGATVGVTKDLFQGALSSGQFGPDNIQIVTTAMAKLQSVSGIAAEEIVKDFATMSSGVAQWAAQKNKSLNFLTLEQYKYIESLEKAGLQEEAMAYAATRINESLTGRQVELGYLETAWKKVGQAASSAWDFMLGLGRPNTISDQIETLQRQLEGADTMRRLMAMRGQTVPPESKELMAMREKLALLQAQQTTTQEVSKAEAQRAQAEKKRIFDEASGYNAKVAANASQQDTIRFQMLADNRLTLNRNAEAQLKADRDRALIDESTYIKKSTELKQQAIDIEMQIVNKRIANVPKARTRDEEVARATELARLQADLNKLSNQRRALGTAGSIEAGTADFRDLKVLREYKADLAAQNDLLALEAKAVSMSNFAYQQLVDTKKQEQAINAKTRDMTPAQAAQFRAAADIEFQRKQQIETLNYQAKTGKALSEHIQSLSHQNDLISMQASQVGMTDFAYQQLVATKQLEYDLMVKTRGMTGEEAAAYRYATQSAFEFQQALEQVNYQQSRTFGYGAQSAVKSYLDDITNIAKATESAMTNAFKGMEDALVEFVMTGKLNFRSLAQSIIADMARIAIQQAIIKPLLGAIGGLFGGGMTAATGALTGGTGNAAGISYQGANGGAFEGGLPRYANGGAFTNSIVSSPTVFGFAGGGAFGLMGEAGPEAIMPLRRGSDGRLGVTAAGGGGATSVVVNVNVESGGEQITSQNGASALGKAVATAVRVELMNQKRPGGLLAA